MPKSTFENLSTEKKQRIYEAAIDEFARTRYEHANISNIIKNAGIPRGSFYQYFEDKLDLYLYIFDEIAKKKIEYMGDLLQKMGQMKFFDLWEELYMRGAKFGIENPKLVEITQLLLSSRDHVYDKLMKNNLKIARDMYVQMIDIDKEKGFIRKDIDSNTLASIVIETTMNVAFDNLVEFVEDSNTFDLMIEEIVKRINIFRKGIEIGE